MKMLGKIVMSVILIGFVAYVVKKCVQEEKPEIYY